MCTFLSVAQATWWSCYPVFEESKFLDMVFNRKLSFIPHIKYLKAKFLKSLNFLKVFSHTSWGADWNTLFKVYRSLVRSKLEYGCIMYGSAQKSYLQMFDPIHNKGLGLALYQNFTTLRIYQYQTKTFWKNILHQIY